MRGLGQPAGDLRHGDGIERLRRIVPTEEGGKEAADQGAEAGRARADDGQVYLDDTGGKSQHRKCRQQRSVGRSYLQIKLIA